MIIPITQGAITEGAVTQGMVVAFLKIYVVIKSPFCGANGTLCFVLKLTLPMGFKARVDPSSSALCSQSQL